jgi:hypothetical protein
LKGREVSGDMIFHNVDDERKHIVAFFLTLMFPSAGVKGVLLARLMEIRKFVVKAYKRF